MTVRDALLMVQIAICALLVTSSVVAVRGLARSLSGNYGFEARNAMLVGTNLTMAGIFSTPYRYDVSPEYFKAAGTAILAGRDFNWHDDKNAPAVAVINRDFAASLFGPGTNAVGRHFALQDGTRVQIVGVVENGKYLSITEDQQPAIFLPSAQSPVSQSYIVVRSNRDPRQLATAIRGKLRELDAGCLLTLGRGTTC